MQVSDDSTANTQDFVLLCKTRLANILDNLNWTKEGVLKNFNTNSTASTVVEKQRKICLPKISTFPESCNTKNSLVLETAKLQQLLQNNQVESPRNFHELQSNFSREEKLKIYEHVIENTDKLEHNIGDLESNGELSLADIVALKKREEKRKKRKFRKSKPTHIEEVRCLVELQMQALQQFMENKLEKDQPIRMNEKHHRQRKISRSREDCHKNKDTYNSEKNGNIRFDGNTTNPNHLLKSAFRRQSRSRSKEFSCHRKGRSRSHNKEFSYQRRRRSVSKNKEFSYEQRKRSRSRSHEMYSRKKSKRSYYDSQSSGRRDYQRNSRRSNTPYKERKERKKCDKKYYSRYSRSPEVTNGSLNKVKEVACKEYYDDKYNTSHQSRSRQRSRSPEPDKYSRKEKMQTEKKSERKTERKKRKRDCS